MMHGQGASRSGSALSIDFAQTIGSGADQFLSAPEPMPVISVP